MSRRRLPRSALALTVSLLLVPSTVLASASAGRAAPPPPAGDDDSVYLVTLPGPGTAGRDRGAGDGGRDQRSRMLADQAAALRSAGSPEPVYRWTTALNGFAVRLTAAQADDLAADPGVATVEPDAIRPLAGTTPPGARGAAGAPGPASFGPASFGPASFGPASFGPASFALAGFDGAAPSAGGRGVVVGVVDSGIAPDSTAFATRSSLGPAPVDFEGGCADGEDWSPSRCGGKLAAAQWYVEGFGRDRVRSGASLSPLDEDGHGTQMASIAVGNAGLPVRVDGRRVATTGGRAPDARLAVYKACWSAPDPRDDGCSTADLVAAVDRAVRDGVDVLSLSVAGPDRVDTLARALLGAAEADTVVVGAAGNDRERAHAAHPVPWVTTVGGAEGVQPRGEVAVAGGPSFAGAMAAGDAVPARPAVLAEEAAAAGVGAARARVCAAGSLDAAAVAGRVVVCRRGLVGRVDKSETVALADGVGMVLVNDGGRSTYADFHAVPTVHLGARAGRELARRVRAVPGTRVSLRPAGPGAAGGVAPWSAAGDPVGGVLKPDLVAPATGLLGAVPVSTRSGGWDVAAGTSAATAWAAGSVAALRGRHPGWSAVEVRSALVTSAARVEGAPGLSGGAGRVAPRRADDARLTYPEDPADYRAWLEGRRTSLNPPSVLLARGATSATRTVRNTARRALYFSSATRGLRGSVRVTPAAVRLGPGESTTFEVTVDRTPARLDDGYVVWRGGDGSRSRIPVVVGR